MEGNSDYLQNLISSTTLETLDSVAAILKMFLQQGRELEIIPKINSLLNNAKTRLVGLQLLETLVPHFSNDGFNTNYTKWLNVCANQGKNCTHQDVTLKFLTTLLAIGNNNDSFIKKFSSECLSNAVQICLNSTSYHKQVALECLIQCLVNFPSGLGNQKAKIETFLLESLDNFDEADAKSAGTTFHFLQQAGPGGVNGVNYAKNYYTHLRKLCATLHVSYDLFFYGFDEVYEYQEISEDAYILKPILNNLNYLDILCKRIINCTLFIRMALCRRYPVEKAIIPINIIDVICRGLSLHICLSQENISIKASFQSLQINRIQLHLLALLRALICCIFDATIPFSHVIINTLANCLKRTENCKCFSENLSFKKNIYRTLNKWLIFSKNADNSVFTDIIIPSLLKDCLISEKTTVSLKNRTNADKTRINKPEPENIYGLELLQTILELRFSNKLQAKEILKHTVKSIVDIIRSRRSSLSPAFQSKLLELLGHFPRSSVYPVNVLAYLLSEGQQSQQFSIRTAANRGLQQLQEVCYDVCYSLNVERKTNLSKQSNTIDLDQPITSVITNIEQSIEDNITEEVPEIIHSPEVTTKKNVPVDVVDEGGEFSIQKDAEISLQISSSTDNNQTENTELSLAVSEHELSGNNQKQSIQAPCGDDEAEEPLAKKIRVDESSPTLEEMLASFQDVPKD